MKIIDAKRITFMDSSMDEKIWKELPGELLEVVMARLPIAAVLRFRLISRKWNYLLKSLRFLQLYDQVSRFRNKLWLFSKNCLIVGNPLTNTWKEFSSRDKFGSLGMVINNTRGYKIIKVYNGQYKVYDSLSTNNTPSCLHPAITGTIPDNIELMEASLNLSPTSYSPLPVTVDSIVYFLTSNPQGILSYDSASGAWEVFPIPIPPNLHYLNLAECGDRILLTGMVWTNGTAYISVWELQWTLLQWTEVDRMPKSWWWSYRGRWASTRCIRNKGLLMMTLEKTPDPGRPQPILTYDAVKREWSKLPPFAIYGRRWFMGLSRGIAFFPSLSATP